MPTLSRRLKDKIPQSVKRRYYDKKRMSQIADSGRLSEIRKVMDDMVVKSPEDWFRAALPSQELTIEAPMNVAAIEINDSCNLDCIMCKTSAAERGKKGLMKLDDFKRVVEKLAERGMRSTNFHTLGDPLANRNLAKYLEVLRQHGINITNMSSNCLMMERHVDTLFEYREIIGSIRPSIDAASKETYEHIRTGGSWDELHRNLIIFTERNEAAKHPFLVYVSSIVAKENWGELAMIPHVFSYLAPPENFGFSFIATQEPTNDYFFKESVPGDAYQVRMPCSRNWQSYYVLKNGDMTTCCQDYYGDIIFGNIFEDDLDEAYNSPFMQGVRTAHLNGKVEDMPRICQKCFVVDPRLDDVLNGIFRYFFLHVKKHPVYLQQALIRMLPMFEAGDMEAVWVEAQKL